MLDINSFEKNALVTIGKTPAPRRSHASVVIGNKLFIYGGWVENFNQKFNKTIHSLDLNIKEWTHIAVNNSPIYTFGSSLFNVGNALYFFGRYS